MSSVLEIFQSGYSGNSSTTPEELPHVAGLPPLSLVSLSTGTSLLRSRNKPQETVYVDSLGLEMTGLAARRRWALTGSASRKWNDHLLPLVKTLVSEKEKTIYKRQDDHDTPVVYHCWMIGIDEQHAHPTVAVCCNCSRILKQVIKVIKRDRELKEEGFKLMDCLGLNLSLTFALETNVWMRTSGMSLSSVLFSVCGAGIRVEGTGRRATIGGTVLIDGRWHALTVAHVLLNNEHDAVIQQKSIASPVFRFYDSDDDDDDCGDDDGSDGSTLSEEDRTPTVSSVGSLEQLYRSLLVTESPLTEDSKSAAVAETEKSYSIQLQVSASSVVDSSKSPFESLDWAVIPLIHEQYHGMNEIPATTGQESSIIETHPLFVRRTSSVAPLGHVLITSCQRTLTGIGTGSAGMKLPGSQIYHDVWTVQMHERISPGTSGAWVVDTISGDAYGIVVACSTVLNEVYLIPIEEILRDIRIKTAAAKVCLPSLEDALCVAAEFEDGIAIVRLVEAGASLKMALLSATVAGYSKAVEELLLRGADPLTSDRSGDTPLHVAARQGLYRIAEVLIEHGAPVNSKNMNMETVLHLAAAKGHDMIVELLLSHDKTVTHLKDKGLRTALDRAKEGNHKRSIELLSLNRTSMLPSFQRYLPPHSQNTTPQKPAASAEYDQLSPGDISAWAWDDARKLWYCWSPTEKCFIFSDGSKLYVQADPYAVISRESSDDSTAADSDEEESYTDAIGDYSQDLQPDVSTDAFLNRFLIH